jgi:hypothetical protein
VSSTELSWFCTPSNNPLDVGSTVQRSHRHNVGRRRLHARLRPGGVGPSQPTSAWILKGCSYDFEYEDDDEEQSGDVDIENKYYNAKQLKGEDPEGAIDEFLGVPALEEEKGDWYAGHM